MTLIAKPTAWQQFEDLRSLSARVGLDPGLVQGPGGNLSIKEDGVLWVKASGTWLANALSEDIFVPVEIAPLLEAISRNDDTAEKPARFVVTARNPRQLRPSIETTLHALMSKTVVVHVHCVETIALAVRQDAERLLHQRLQGLNWTFVPYRRPGLPLTRAIADRLKANTDVLILGNHGLVVAAETVSEASALLDRVVGLLAHPPRETGSADVASLAKLAEGSPYRLPSDVKTHEAAMDPIGCRIIAGGSLYPDHVIFLGRGSIIAGPKDTAESIGANALANGRPVPMSIHFPGKGVLMHSIANLSAEAMGRCLAEVVTRIPGDAAINYLTDHENDALLDWEAERYRQTIVR